MPAHETKTHRTRPVSPKLIPRHGPNAFWVKDDEDTYYLLDPDKQLEHGCEVAVSWGDGSLSFPLYCHTEHPDRASTLSIAASNGEVAQGFKRASVFRVVAICKPI